MIYPGEVPVAMRLVSQALRRMGKYGEAVEMEKRRAEFSRAEGLLNAEADAYYWLVNIYRFDLGEPALAAEFAEKYTNSLIRPGRRLTVNECDRIAGDRQLEVRVAALQSERAQAVPDERALRGLRLPDVRIVRRHVHRQYDELSNRGVGYDLAG